MTGAHAERLDELDRFERRVRAAIAANVDLMDGPPRVVERAMSGLRRARRRRQRRRIAALGVVVAMIAVSMASGWRPQRRSRERRNSRVASRPG